jgi:hypothetical protein
MQTKDVEEKIRDIVKQELRYIKTYVGQVVDVEDPLKRGRVKCYVLELGWIDGESSIWVNPSNTKSMLKLKKDDYVRIGFMNGDRTRAYFTGMAQEIKEMYPENFDGTKQVLFESNEKDFFATYDDTLKELYTEIGDNTFTINQDGIVKEDINGNKGEWTSSGIKWTDANGNTLEMTGSTVDINGNTKKFVTYTELNNAITTFLVAVMAHVHTSAAPGAPTSTPTAPITFDISAAESLLARTG